MHARIETPPRRSRVETGRQLPRGPECEAPSRLRTYDAFASGVDADAFDFYVHEVSRHPLLTKEEERALFQRLAQGDELARHQLVEANLRLVIAVARKYKHQGLPLQDLVQEGNQGLLRAIAKFRIEKGYRFSTYAIWWIRQSMTRALSERSRVIRLPSHVTEKRAAVSQAVEALGVELGRKPTEEEIAERAGLSLRQLRSVRRVPDEPASLHVPTEAGTEIGDMVPAGKEGAPGYLAQRNDLEETVQRSLARLGARERKVLALRFGFADQGHFTRRFRAHFGTTPAAWRRRRPPSL